MGRGRSLGVLFGSELHASIFQIGDRRVGFPAKPEVQSQARRNTKCITAVDCLIVMAAKLDLPVRLAELRHEAEDVIGLIEAAKPAIEPVESGPIEHVV